MATASAIEKLRASEAKQAAEELAAIRDALARVEAKLDALAASPPAKPVAPPKR